MQRKSRGVEMESPLNEQKQYIAIQNCNLANKALGEQDCFLHSWKWEKKDRI